MKKFNLFDYQKIIINSSAGKDSLAAIFEVCRLADAAGYPKSNIVVSHQCLGDMEWKGTKELAAKQAELFGLKIYYSKRRDRNGVEETLLEYVKRRGKWPSLKQRYCTSDFKRGPGGRVVTEVCKGIKGSVLYVFGFRAEESPSRKKKQVLTLNKPQTTKSRLVYDWLPIHNWSVEKVWQTIKENNLPYHPAYDLGMPRLSCVFCVFSPFDALVIADKANPELLNQYVDTESEIGHSFKDGKRISEVKEAIKNGYQPTKVKNWIM